MTVVQFASDPYKTPLLFDEKKTKQLPAGHQEMNRLIAKTKGAQKIQITKSNP